MKTKSYLVLSTLVFLSITSCGVSIPKDFVVPTNGKDNRQNATNKMKTMSANGGKNLVIFDADDDVEKRRTELLSWKEKENLDFELFLIPNDKEAGALETLLENIINPRIFTPNVYENSIV